MQKYDSSKNKRIIGSLFVLCVLVLYGLFSALRVHAEVTDIACASWDKKVLIIPKTDAKPEQRLIFKSTDKITPEQLVAADKIFCLNGSDRAITATGASADDPSFDANVLPNKGIQFLQYALSFLAIIGVAMILWGGFTWMSSGGNEQTIDRARKILLAALIGLVVITSAWVIVSFVVKLGQQSLGA